MGFFNFGRKKKEHLYRKHSAAPQDIEIDSKSFCMWKPTKKDRSFSKSRVIKLIDELFDVVDGRELEAHSILAIMTGNGNKILKKIPDEEKRVLSLRDPRLPFVFSLSKRKGLRLYFDYEKSSHELIEKCLEGTVAMFKDAFNKEEKRSSLTEGKIWWKRMKTLASTKHKRKIESIGQLI